MVSRDGVIGVFGKSERRMGWQGVGSSEIGRRRGRQRRAMHICQWICKEI